MPERVAIIGAGAWGTALAVHLARSVSVAVSLIARDRIQAEAMRAERQNTRYLPGVRLPDAIEVVSDLAVTANASTVIIATPMAALLDVVRLLDPITRAPLAWLCKGFVSDAGTPAGVALAHQVIAPRWPQPVGIISGPSFAEEVAAGLPTALAVAATDFTLAERLATILRGSAMRVYASDDIAGVEVGGAVKNVLAIAAGASDGLGFGDNARAALITRGLAETGRLSQALGGRRETLMGLAGLGDLVLTCTGNRSRNRRVGLALAEGRSLPDILCALGHVAEGVAAARAVRLLARGLGVDLPICDAVDRVLHEGVSPRSAVAELLAREPGRE
jgi:glycerol-3-phosphate dehydrogenase (NAD(P)+)